MKRPESPATTARPSLREIRRWLNSRRARANGSEPFQHFPRSAYRMAPEIDTKLERLIHRQLKEQPPLKAPPALLMRVLAAARQQQALPWWKQSIWHWPIA